MWARFFWLGVLHWQAVVSRVVTVFSIGDREFLDKLNI
jgi:hypothetical protein